MVAKEVRPEIVPPVIEAAVKVVAPLKVAAPATDKLLEKTTAPVTERVLDKLRADPAILPLNVELPVTPRVPEKAAAPPEVRENPGAVTASENVAGPVTPNEVIPEIVPLVNAAAEPANVARLSLSSPKVTRLLLLPSLASNKDKESKGSS
ncbi:hypothetical protein HY772_05850 [Candidatus Woesearchaeota archaeon]|nr:hypothetical protein [Candidatus Woesearchaeota archaeon]